MSRLRQDISELGRHLEEQIQFLEASANAFDDGHIGESKRMAVSVRILVHDTRSSTSLLRQLDMKKRKFYDTASEYRSTNLLGHSGLTSILVSTQGGAQHVALLDDTYHKRWIDFEQWWSKIVFSNLGEENLTRKDVVLGLANQDGGAHVDPELDEKFARVSRLNALQHYEVLKSGQEVPMRQPEQVAMRQIAHEILKTLNSDYEKRGPTPPLSEAHQGEKDSFSHVTIAGPHIDVQTSPPRITPHRNIDQVGRNDLCHCGSGIKYKYCCGMS